jgi:putative oxidoreductase
MTCPAIAARLMPAATIAGAVLSDLGALLARITLGQAFMLTGLGKLRHLDRTTEFFTNLGIPAPHLHAMGIGALELVGGTLLIVGFAVRPFSALLLATMAVAILTADRSDFVGALAVSPDKGLTDVVPWMFGLILLGLLAHGSGRLGVDHWLWRRCTAAGAPKKTLTAG